MGMREEKQVNSYLELLSPRKISESTHRRQLEEAGIKGGWNYALDHAWLFEQIEKHVMGLKDHPVILDIGCGNSMLHTFLEKRLNLGIIGIDRIKGLCPHTPGRTAIMDICGDFRTVSRTFAGLADIIFWLSSIEHNSPTEQRECVQASLNALKPGGLFLATFGFSDVCHYYRESEQWNLSRDEAVAVFRVPWKEPPDFSATVQEYQLDLMDLDTKHLNRYRSRDYDFVVAGACIRNLGIFDA